MSNYPPAPFFYDPAYQSYQFPVFPESSENLAPFPQGFQNWRELPVAQNGPMIERNGFDSQSNNLNLQNNEESTRNFKWMDKKRGGKAADKKPTSFTKFQSMELEKEFIHKNYLPLGKKDELAAKLGLTPTQVKTWFQNRRMKEKKYKKPERVDNSSNFSENSENSSPESAGRFATWQSF